MGGLSPEREISLVSGNAVLEAVKRKGLNGIGIDVDHNIASTLQKKKSTWLLSRFTEFMGRMERFKDSLSTRKYRTPGLGF